jgi:hypothetical protein
MNFSIHDFLAAPASSATRLAFADEISRHDDALVKRIEQGPRASWGQGPQRGA